MAWINFKGNTSIIWLSIRNNPLENVQNLPAFLQELFADKNAVLRYDFSLLPDLKQLHIFKE
jgi:hypothetical protein